MPDAADTWAARARASGEELAAIAQGAIDYFLEHDRRLPVAPVLQYSWAMHRQGRARAAIDYLRSKHPRIGDPAWLPPTDSLFTLHGYSMALWFDIEGQRDFAARIEKWVQTLTESGLLAEPIPSNYESIALALWQNDSAQAKRLLSRIDPATDTMTWVQLEQDPNPIIDAFRQDPEVAELFAKAAIWRNETREQFIQMLARPEWAAKQDVAQSP